MSAGATIRILCERTGKQVIGTVDRAERMRIHLEDVTGCRYRVYRCEFCGWFHLTSHRKRAQ